MSSRKKSKRYIPSQIIDDKPHLPEHSENKSPLSIQSQINNQQPKNNKSKKSQWAIKNLITDKLKNRTYFRPIKKSKNHQLQQEVIRLEEQVKKLKTQNKKLSLSNVQLLTRTPSPSTTSVVPPPPPPKIALPPPPPPPPPPAISKIPLFKPIIKPKLDTSSGAEIRRKSSVDNKGFAVTADQILSISTRLRKATSSDTKPKVNTQSIDVSAVLRQGIKSRRSSLCPDQTDENKPNTSPNKMFTVGLRKVNLQRSPGGTPYKATPTPSNFHTDHSKLFNKDLAIASQLESSPKSSW